MEGHKYSPDTCHQRQGKKDWKENNQIGRATSTFLIGIFHLFTSLIIYICKILKITKETKSPVSF